LQGRAVLVVEDEYLQAEDMVQALGEAGARVIGPFPIAASAIKAMRSETGIDAAVLDINLRGNDVFTLAWLLHENSTPFMFASGYDRKVLPEDYRDVPLLEKPFALEQLIGTPTKICDGKKPG